MGEAVVSCAKCGARRAFRGTHWEVKVMADVWLNEHERAGHDGEGGAAGGGGECLGYEGGSGGPLASHADAERSRRLWASR